MRRSLLLTMAIACGVAVANVYFPQAMTPLIARGLDVSTGTAALVPTATQLGYAAGIALLVPLGDRLAHRPFVAGLLAVTTVGSVVAGLAPTLPVLLGAAILIGIATVVPQVLLPLAASLVEPERRGAVTGLLLSGLLAGILLARAFGGLLGDWLGWRTPYLVAAVLTATLAVVLVRVLPATTPASRESYPALVAMPLRLLRREPELRRSCLYQALMFGGFTAAWTSLTLLITGPTFRLSASVVGLVALVGAASAFATAWAGRQADRRGPDAVNLLSFLGAIGAAAILTAATLGGVAGLVAVILGMLLLDVAVQTGQVANQTRIFALDPAVRSRLNTAYMTAAFLGGTVGSWLGVHAYLRYGWFTIPSLIALTASIALLRHLRRSRSLVDVLEVGQ
ncbi:MFS transporter [Kribbella kalugense]|uniref:Putative MFS family arabinose efflux permease n=1 Tax=Kribbella kalugense TaxID=2512221 RepID=A0A4R7ZJR3_9ACTN|nr:MFS transporter [Kribbella kalugense]TDW17406.1 putative MFS family arabinose efflux permease [Kribbella kalugense]